MAPVLLSTISNSKKPLKAECELDFMLVNVKLLLVASEFELISISKSRLGTCSFVLLHFSVYPTLINSLRDQGFFKADSNAVDFKLRKSS